MLNSDSSGHRVVLCNQRQEAPANSFVHNLGAMLVCEQYASVSYIEDMREIYY